MKGTDYDIVVVGGGVCGASLATVMARADTRVLVLERETQFRDRVRGEYVEPWGVAELHALTIYRTLKEAGAHELLTLTTGSARKEPRDLVRTSAPRRPALTFYHPSAQEALLNRAAAAGAEVRRGASVRKVRPASPPSVVVHHDGRSEEITARLVVGADGRSSLARKALAPADHTNDQARLIAGVLLDSVSTPENSALIAMNPKASLVAYLFPQGGGRARAYVAFRAGACEPMRGEGDLDRLIDASVEAGAPAEAYAGVTASGLLATFAGTERWADHPYRDGVVLIGDAAGISDPTWGQGLSLGFRDVRVLRDLLLASQDWDAAGHAYAVAHDRYFLTTLKVVGWVTEFFLGMGPEADERRARARPLARQDPTRVPDHIVSGPDLPADETVRRRFFGEE